MGASKPVNPLVAAALKAKLNERFVSAYLVSRPFMRSHEKDLRQEAVIGIMKAAENFDPTRGTAFESHAWWWMKATTRTYLRHAVGGDAPSFNDPAQTFEHPDSPGVASFVDTIPAPCQIEASENRLDAPKVWAQTFDQLAALPKRRGTHTTPNAEAERRRAAEVFFRNVIKGETTREIAKDAGCSFQNVAQTAEKMRGEFKRLFPQAHAALCS